MNNITKLLYRELYKKSLYDFVKDFWNTCDPSRFVDGKLVRYYCEIFQFYCRKWTGAEIKDVQVETKEGEEVVRMGDKNCLCLNVPPRHTKSMIFNVFGPTWLWLSYPIKGVSVSHTGGLATQMNTKRYRIINSEKFKEIFSDITLESNTKSSLVDVRGGELYSMNRNAFTGYGGDIIINDDLTNAETARKDKAEMENAWSYYKNTMPSRINNPEKCIIMNIQQRLAPNDITGHILNDEKLAQSYSFIVMPAYFEKTTHYVCPISGEVITWEKGEYLWPERFGDYENLKVQVGESVFETQYMQHPIASDKTIIKSDLIKEVNKTEAPSIDDADMIYASHDFPVKDKEESDYLGSVLAYRVNNTLYIKDVLEKRMDFVRSVKYVKDLDIALPGIIQIIEDKANGSPILQQLQDEVAGMQAYQPGTNSKSQRLESASLYMSSGNVKFLKEEFNEINNRWQVSESIKNLETRLTNFPFVEHDDIIDAFTQLILFVFMDKRYSVYARSFNDDNIINTVKNIVFNDVTTFFNKEGDTWKALKVAIKYGVESKMYVVGETKFKASSRDGINKLKEFAEGKKVLIDCSSSDGLYGINEGITIERYEDEDFDKSVNLLNLNFAKNKILILNNCHLVKGDIENFKFSKSKDENVKYVTEKDGFVACLRIALKYYGGLN